jgi:SAM-dependent methyltransferase
MTQGVASRSGRDGWGAWWVRRHYHAEGFTDAGEQAAVSALGQALQGAAVLDLGVGGGRTTAFLAAPARRYLGIDSSAGMVRLARGRRPGDDIRLGDARHLDGIEDGSYDIVVFSNNGIDAVGHDGRAAVLAEVARVLRPGGLLQFSTFNVDGSTSHQRPDFSELRRPTDRPAYLAPLVFAKRLVDALVGRWHFRRSEPLSQAGEGWAVAPLRPHEYRFAVHFIRFGAAVGELEAHGFVVEAAWTPEGVALDLQAPTTDAEYVQLLARRAA